MVCYSTKFGYAFQCSLAVINRYSQLVINVNRRDSLITTNRMGLGTTGIISGRDCCYSLVRAPGKSHPISRCTSVEANSFVSKLLTNIIKTINKGIEEKSDDRL